MRHSRSWPFWAILLLCGRAQGAPVDQRGIFVYSEHLPKDQLMLIQALTTVPGIDGLTLLQDWSSFETAPGAYDWTQMDFWMNTAISSGKKVTLAIRAGGSTPCWLFQTGQCGAGYNGQYAGATALNFQVSARQGIGQGSCNAATLAAPWDPIFLAQWDSALAALAAHLKSAGSYNTVSSLRLTGINRTTAELRLPEEILTTPCVTNSIPTWLQANPPYRPARLLQAWDAITNSFAKSFPDKYFGLEVVPDHTGNNSYPLPEIDDNGCIYSAVVAPGSAPGACVNNAKLPDDVAPLVNLASQKFAGRLTVSFQNLDLTAGANSYPIQDAQTLGTGIGYQTNDYNNLHQAACSGGILNPGPCTSATYLALLEVGIYPLGPTDNLRGQYIEVLPPDAIAFPDAVLQAHNEIFGLVPPPGPPVISLSNTQLQFWDYTAQSSLTPPQAIGVSNTGGGTLSFTSTPNSPWINVTSTSSGFTVSVSPAGLAVGPHSSTISVAAPGATNSPQTVSVTLTISASTQIPPPSAARFVPVTPCRVADTRNPTGPFGGPGLPSQTARDFAIPASACGIPSAAVAYSLNVAVVPSGPLGYVTLWPTGQPQPLVATLNSIDGRVKSNAAIVPAGRNGAISAFVTDSTGVILDINGYFVAASNAAALEFYPVTPCRVADTRNPAGPLGGPGLAAQATRSFPILASSCGVPASAQAYALNFAAVPKGPTLGYMTAWPAGQGQPLVASLNDPTGTVLSNAVVVPAGTGGAVNVYATDATDLVIDINGYFAPPGAGGLSLYTVAPCRVLDSRLPAGSPPFNTTRDVNVTGSPCGVPAAGKAYVFNATVVPPGFLGYITMWPLGQSQPLAATLNAYDGAVTNNMAIVPTTTGSISVYPSDPTQLVLDLFGYFAP
jgi:hypothetical protein